MPAAVSPPTSVYASGNTALITGAASGIGLAYAKLCREYGMKLALVDLHAQNLELARDSLGTDILTETYAMDVSSRDEWFMLREKVVATFGRIDLLMLNAGVGAKGHWDDWQYFETTLNVNLYGVVYGINAFVPLMQSQKSQKPSAIVFTGSKRGFSNSPGNPAYNASKAAVNSLAQQLSFDLRDTNTTVHLCLPGWTYTGQEGGGPAPSTTIKARQWTPEQVADYLKGKVDSGHFWVICPDNEVTEDMDKRRMMWTIGDAVHNRLPLSRWREEYKEQSLRDMAAMTL